VQVAFYFSAVCSLTWFCPQSTRGFKFPSRRLDLPSQPGPALNFLRTANKAHEYTRPTGSFTVFSN